MKKTLISAAIVGLLFSPFISCKEEKEEKIQTKEVSFKKEGDLVIKKATNDSIVASLAIEIAEGEYETQTGLMYRSSMQNDRGMLFVFPTEIVRSFYMKNTEFALDIIYLSSEKKIVSIQKNAKPLDPTSLPAEAPTQYVLEVNAGLSDTWGLAAGDVVEWTLD